MGPSKCFLRALKGPYRPLWAHGPREDIAAFRHVYSYPCADMFIVTLAVTGKVDGNGKASGKRYKAPITGKGLSAIQ